MDAPALFREGRRINQESARPIRAYIINLDRAPDRWESVSRAFAGTKIPVERVPGVDGNTLQAPIAGYAEGLYHWFHGRPTNPRHVGCYFSHVKALKAFLASEEEHALIGEDDLTLNGDFEAAIEGALRFSRHWNIVRLTALGRGKPALVADLGHGYGLHVSFHRLKGTGAYLVDRRAARAWVTGLLPMRLPIDHAVDREWFQGLRAMCILPFPASQIETGFKSSIHVGKTLKRPAWQRWVGTYPYQIFNELTRWVFRGISYFTAKMNRSGPPRSGN